MSGQEMKLTIIEAVKVLSKARIGRKVKVNVGEQSDVLKGLPGVMTLVERQKGEIVFRIDVSAGSEDYERVRAALQRFVDADLA
jgi:hypothetical protein